MISNAVVTVTCDRLRIFLGNRHTRCMSTHRLVFIISARSHDIEIQFNCVVYNHPISIVQ